LPEASSPSDNRSQKQDPNNPFPLFPRRSRLGRRYLPFFPRSRHATSWRRRAHSPCENPYPSLPEARRKTKHVSRAA